MVGSALSIVFVLACGVCSSCVLCFVVGGDAITLFLDCVKLVLVCGSFEDLLEVSVGFLGPRSVCRHGSGRSAALVAYNFLKILSITASRPQISLLSFLRLLVAVERRAHNL